MTSNVAHFGMKFKMKQDGDFYKTFALFVS